MKIISKFILFICFYLYIYSQLNYNIYTLEELFSFLYNQTETEENLKFILDCLSSTLNEVYAFNEISKNPPQPEFDNNYYKKVNIQERLKNIKTKDTNLYLFYQDIHKLFCELGDFHLNLFWDIILKKIVFLEPVKLIIKEYENTSKIYAEIYPNKELFEHFDNHETLSTIINDNKNVSIKEINGQDPFDFIINFGKEYNKFKSPQAIFRYKFYLRSPGNFFDYPFNSEDLNNFTLVYENGKNFSTNYVIYSQKNLSEATFFNNKKLFIDKMKKMKKINLNNIKAGSDSFNFINDIFYNEMFNYYKNNNFKNSTNTKTVEWDYIYDYLLFCRVDNEKKINMYASLAFDININNDFINAVKKCTELFDKNDYPIVLIMIFNLGGIIDNSHFLLEALSPRTTVNIYSAFKNNIKNTQTVGEILSQFSDPENCEILNYTILKGKNHTIDYGNGYSEILLGPAILSGKKLREEINLMKKNLKNIRKPTEILVYTDGFSFSAAAMLVKYLQYYGGAITAGYFLNPKLNNIPFDSGISGSILFPYKIINNLDIEDYIKLYNKTGLFFQTPGIPTFFTPNDLSHPLEYEINPVDEKVNIYMDDVDVFNLLEQNTYDKFVNESFNIFEKYKTKCNPNNKKLLLLTEKCDGDFGNSYTHGGYICGNDGYWTNQCVASYCDIGYIFDHNTNKCIIDICSSLTPDSDSDSVPVHEPESNNYIIKLILIVIFTIIIITIIIFVMIKRKSKRKKLTENYNNFSINESLTMN